MAGRRHQEDSGSGASRRPQHPRWSVRRTLQFAVAVPLLLLTLLVLEATLQQVRSGGSPSLFRSSDYPGLIYDAEPNLRAEQGQDSRISPWLVSIDQEGARQAPPGEPGCPILWVFGDSFAHGWGVGDDQTWPAQLQVALTGVLGCRPTVRNWALPGYNLSQMHARMKLLFERSGSSMSPDLLLLHLEEFDGFPDFDFSNPLGLPGFLQRSSFLRPFQVLRAHNFDRSVTDDPAARAAQNTRLKEELTRLHRMIIQQGLTLLPIVEPEVPSSIRSQLHRDFGGLVPLESCNGLRFELDPHYDIEGNACVAALVSHAAIERLRRL